MLNAQISMSLQLEKYHTYKEYFFVTIQRMLLKTVSKMPNPGFFLHGATR